MPDPCADRLGGSPRDARERRRIAFAIKAMGAQGGGAERVLADVANGLAARGHSVVIVSYDRAETPDFYALDPAIERVRLGVGETHKPTGLRETLTRLPRLRSAIKSFAPDVAVGFMHSIYIPMVAALVGTKTPLIASDHIVYDHFRTRPLEGALLRVAAPWFAAMTAVSPTARDTYPPAVARRMRVIPNPVSASPGAMADTRGAVRKRVLTVGRLAEQKDQRTLIAAFAQLASEFPDWDLRIVGEGDLRPALERQIADLGMSHRIDLAGAVSDVASEYAAAQMFALPSSYESFGLVTAEAFAHGLPVVGFADCPGTNALVVDGVNGILVGGPDRIAAFADGLRRLMGDAVLRVRLGDAAPASVAEFSTERVIVAWEGLIYSVEA
ncbi:glycosyltransferase family 4 protein [Flavisphingopyxis soli]|uniref:glycosyltransferase family 4 protein n=1 Tax=Flavisphingopyxis soli TaxID=2601267 RepID=UPI0013762304|nr:glycosyltransferase family 4 protein [Sphingorhabdus soli]